jgi:hypothetical protein
MRLVPKLENRKILALVFQGLAAQLLITNTARGQDWTWKTESVDQAGAFMSLKADAQGNLHIAYMIEDQGVKYGFRPAGSSRWFTFVVDRRPGFTSLDVDREGNPHICHNAEGSFFYSHWDGKDWVTQQIAPGSGNISFSCSIGVSVKGVPHLFWYQYGAAASPFYLHIKHAVLQDGAWLARTIDYDGETGKWNSAVIDPHGNPRVVYSSFQRGELKYAQWDGKTWAVQAVDSRGRTPTDMTNRGFGNSLVLDAKGNAHSSYFDDAFLKYAYQEGKAWVTQFVDGAPASEDWSEYRSSLILDQHGHPHIAYESAGVVKHAYWDGKRWHIQIISPRGNDLHCYSSMAMDPEGTLYIAYRDSSDGSLKLAVGQPVKEGHATAPATR